MLLFEKYVLHIYKFSQWMFDVFWAFLNGKLSKIHSLSVYYFMYRRVLFLLFSHIVAPPFNKIPASCLDPNKPLRLGAPLALNIYVQHMKFCGILYFIYSYANFIGFSFESCVSVTRIVFSVLQSLSFDEI